MFTQDICKFYDYLWTAHLKLNVWRSFKTLGFLSAKKGHNFVVCYNEAADISSFESYRSSCALQLDTPVFASSSHGWGAYEEHDE
jgi:hypothetical protein